MLAAAQRVRRRADFAVAIRGGRRAGRGALVVHLVAAEPAVVSTSTKPAHTVEAPLPARAGFVVPKTVGNAVTRNRVRRRLRHLVRDRLPELPAASMVVVRVLPGAADLSYIELGEQLDGAIDAARRPRHRGRR